MNEIWREIPGYKGIYEASTLGRIRTIEGKTTSSSRFSHRVWKQRIIKPKGQTIKTGYRVSLWKDGVHKDWLVARLIAMTFVDLLDQPKPTVNHKDGNRFNNCIENLEWASLGDNIRHAFNTGLMSSSQKSVTLEDKASGVVTMYRSMAEAGRAYGFNDGYICTLLKRGKVETDQFIIL